MPAMIDWEAKWSTLTRDSAEACTTAYWDRRADDYDDFMRTSDFCHGRAIREVCQREGLFAHGDAVLDIAAGPGAITVPFSEMAGSLVAIEPSAAMADRLAANVAAADHGGVTVVRSRWEDVDVAAHTHAFDLVLCVHGSWHFAHLVRQIERMEHVSRGHCGFAEGVPTDNPSRVLQDRLGGADARVDRAQLLFNLLHQIQRLPSLHIIEVVNRRSVRSALRSWELSLGKYRHPTAEELALIREHVEACSEDGVYESRGRMALISWPAVRA